MKAAENLGFEQVAQCRDKILELKKIKIAQP